MEVFYRKRDKKINLQVIKDIEKGFNLYKEGKTLVNYIGSKCNFDDKIQGLDDKNNSNEIFKDILNIGKQLENLIDEYEINDIEFTKEDWSSSYERIITNTLEKNIDEMKDITLKFIKKYGSFMTAFSKTDNPIQTFNVLEFLFRCYLIYEIHILYNCVLYFKPSKLKIFNNTYKLKIEKPNWKSEGYSGYMSDDRDDFFNIIDEKLELLDKKSMAVRFLTIRDYEKDEDGNKNFTERWKTVMLFSTPLNVAIYELKLELSNNTETTFVVCKNPECNNVFERKSGRKKYCDDYECILSRQRLRANKSLYNKKMSKN